MDLKEFVVMCINKAEIICDDKNASADDKKEAIRFLNLAISSIREAIEKIK